MPERLPRELRVLYRVARGASAPSSRDDAVRRLCEELEAQFAFDEVRFVGDDAEREDLVLLDAALEEGRAVAGRCRVAIPLLDEDRCLGYLLADRREALFDQTVRLNALTEQLLDLSRLDSGRIRVEARPFRPREAVEALLIRIAPDRRSDVRVEIGPDEEIVSDPVAFDRVVGNLLANALKYGRPPVVVRASEDSVTVEDGGPGIPPEFVPYLFDRFTR